MMKKLRFDAQNELKNGSFIEHPSAAAIVKRLERVYNAAGTPNTGFTLIGGTGSGKSTILKWFTNTVNLADSFDTGETRTVPIVYIKPREQADRTMILCAILSALNVPFDEGQGYKKLRKKALEQLKKQGVKVLIVDEFHHALRSATSKEAINTVAFLKLLNEEADPPIPLVVAGTEDVDLWFPRHKELYNRVGDNENIVRLNSMSVCNKEDNQIYQDFLMGIGKKLRNFEIDAKILLKTEIQHALLIQSRGNPRKLVNFLCDVLDSVNDLSRPLVGNDFKATYAAAKKLNRKLPRNPFTLTSTDLLNEAYRVR